MSKQSKTIDVFSRYVVGWMVAPRESAMLAERLIRETCERHGISRDLPFLDQGQGVPAAQRWRTPSAVSMAILL